MKEIKLTQGKVALVDNADLDVIDLCLKQVHGLQFKPTEVWIYHNGEWIDLKDPKNIDIIELL